ncbi:MAG: SIR2 family protein, partial [Thermoleophilia bacterium]
MGAPANLPSFVRLAREIAVPKVPWKPIYAKGLDMYLGRAERENVDVQARARRILDVGGAHTPLHEDLLGLFGTADRVRLITTNFDTHFASAAAQVFPGERMPEYVGPALPPGQGFRGIAQLHGSLDRPESRLVLTDGDFAAAYMAEGWAARFLARVFADRAVLFVGYSLSDPIMRYLLHALPPTGRWFALWHRSAAGQGAEHRIHPVTFGKPRARDRYRDLNDGLKRWRWYATARAVDHDRELRRLVALGPPSSPLDADYLRARLLTNEGREVFWEVARGDRWFDWVASEGLLDGLVDPRGRDPYAA